MISLLGLVAAAWLMGEACGIKRASASVREELRRKHERERVAHTSWWRA